MRSFPVISLLLLLAAHPLYAADGLYLTWNDCAALGAGQSTQGFACDTDAGSHTLVCALTVGAPVDSVLGMEIVVDLQVAAAAMPDWWRFDAGGCRAGDLRADTNFGGFPTCVDPWQTLASGGVLTYTVGMPRGGAGQARIVIGLAVPSNQPPRALDAVDMYYAARILIDDVGTSTCGGCTDAACLVLNSILLRRPLRPEGIPSADVLVTAVGAAGANWASWQSSSANCMAVPVKNRTWGAVKAIYR